MSGIRPLEPDDIPGVARLYERVARSGTRSAPPGVEGFFRETLFESPWADPELPSLVYEDQDAGLVGFMASHPRRLLLDGRPVRMGVTAQLVADPDFAKPGVGAVLIRAYNRGAQDLTLTDGATPLVRAMWEGLGGATLPLQSLAWTRVLRPARFAAVVAERRGGRSPRRSAAALEALASPLSRRWLRPAEPPGSAEPLTISALLDLVDRGRWSVRPAYDEPFLEWLFAQMEAVPGRGQLRRLLIRDDAGDPLGWGVYYRDSDGISQVQQLAALGDPGPVFDHVIWDAAGAGSPAVQGRLESALMQPLSERPCLIRHSEWALVQTADSELMAALGAGNPLLTRMDGEWWMGPHLIPAEASAASV